MGSSTEVSLLNFLERCQININEYLLKYPIRRKFPFNSTRKRMSVVIKNGENFRLLLKGSYLHFISIISYLGGADMILNDCNYMHTFENETIQLKANKKLEISHAITGTNS